MSDSTTAVERYQRALSEVEHTTLLGFRGFTRDAYALDPRQFAVWCWQHDRRLFDVRRVDIECLGRDLEDLGKARATVARRLCTIVDRTPRSSPDLAGRRPSAPHRRSPSRLIEAGFLRARFGRTVARLSRPDRPAAADIPGSRKRRAASRSPSPGEHGGGPAARCAPLARRR